MHIYLKRTAGASYVSDEGWTASLEQARRFVTGADAALYCSRRQLQDMECLYSFPDPKHNFSIPVDSLQNPTLLRVH